MGIEKLAKKDVITIPSDATLRDAAKTMRDRHVGDVVVLKPGNAPNKPIPAGILTDRDIVVSTIALGIDPSTVRVGDVMSPTLATAKPEDSFSHVLNLMKEKGIKRIPLVDDDGALAGILSAGDIIALLAAEMGDVAKITDKQRIVEIDRRRKLA